MTYELTGRRKPTKIKKQARGAKRKRDDVDVEKLSAAVAALVCVFHIRETGSLGKD